VSSVWIHENRDHDSMVGGWTVPLSSPSSSSSSSPSLLPSLAIPFGLALFPHSNELASESEIPILVSSKAIHFSPSLSALKHTLKHQVVVSKPDGSRTQRHVLSDTDMVNTDTDPIRNHRGLDPSANMDGDGIKRSISTGKQEEFKTDDDKGSDPSSRETSDIKVKEGSNSKGESNKEHEKDSSMSSVESQGPHEKRDRGQGQIQVHHPKGQTIKKGQKEGHEVTKSKTDLNPKTRTRRRTKRRIKDENDNDSENENGQQGLKKEKEKEPKLKKEKEKEKKEKKR